MMAEDPANVWSTAKRATVTTITGAIVGGLITWAVGWLPAVWASIQMAAVSMWSLISLSVPVPFGILAIITLLFTVRIVRAVQYYRYKQEAMAAPEQLTEPQGAPALSELERNLLQLLAHADGRNVKFEDAVAHMHVSRMVLERKCEDLQQRGFIKPHHDNLYGAQIALTRAGRDFVIEQGFRLGRIPVVG